jgi:hypothetical protein
LSGLQQAGELLDGLGVHGVRLSVRWFDGVAAGAAALIGVGSGFVVAGPVFIR